MSTHCLTVLGLGPGDPRQRTREAEEVLAAASCIILRTGVHPGIDDLLANPLVQTCDDLYESSPSFERVYDAVVERVWSALDASDVVYAVPGHPLVGERTVRSLITLAGEQARPVRIVSGISALDAFATALQVDLISDQPQILDAVDLHHFVERDPFNGWLPDCSPLRPLIVSQVFSRAIASSVKLALSRLYPEEHAVVLVSAAGVAGEEQVERCLLFELDRSRVDHLTSLWVPPLDALEATHWPPTLQRISAQLRAPNGCPWDRKQSHQSLRSAVIEEAYEVADAIDIDDPDHLAEELGDLLLQVALHAQIAEESGEFTIGDIYDHINRKLVRRHPHVFGDVVAGTPEAVISTWEGVKAQERAARQLPAREEADPFDRLPRSMPVASKLAEVLTDLGSERVRLDGPEREPLGAKLLQIVRETIQAGLDPEQELERAYRAWRRSAANADFAEQSAR